MRRIKHSEGQLPLAFGMEAQAPQQTTTPPVAVGDVAVPPASRPAPAKVRRKQPVISNGPSVTLHKAGRKILVKANDVIAADIWRDLKDRIKTPSLRQVRLYTGEGDEVVPTEDIEQIQWWRHLDKDPADLSFCRILRSYGVEVNVDTSLRNFMRREARRQAVENTPFPLRPIQMDVSLYDRCCEGTVLRCVRDYEAGPDRRFEAGKRYVVVSTGAEGRDVVVVSVDPVEDRTSLSASSQRTVEWTSFHPNMEEVFTDSEEYDVGEDIEKRFPNLVQQMQSRLEKLNLPLYEHVKKDVVLMALKRGGINAYRMRMGKTSFSIAWGLLRGYKSIAMIAPRNARIHAVGEFERMGLKKGQDFVVVDSFADLEKPARFYLMTPTWLRKEQDKGYKSRKDGLGKLKPSRWSPKLTVEDLGAGVEVCERPSFNRCPHCTENLERYVNGKWTKARGYRCRNYRCGSPGYIDYELAAHADCPDEKVPARMCPSCKTADGVWKPAPYKRIRKLFNAEIADEVHSCKDPSTATAKSSFGLKVKGRQGLTGTLISNSPLDSYYPAHWAVNAPNTGFPYSRSEGASQFDKRFCDAVLLEKTIGESVDATTGKKAAITKTVRKRIPFLKNPPDFWRFMAPKVLRRTYDDPLYQEALTQAGMKMPIPDFKKYVCPMDPHQAALTLSLIKDFRGQFAKIVRDAENKGHNLNSAVIISQMITLKTAATCPEMLNQKAGTSVYKGVAGGGKISHIYNLVKSKVSKGGKVLILSDFVQMQKTCEEALKEFNPIRFNVGWDDEARKEAFEAFQEGEINKVFIAGTGSVRSVLEGSDLSAADTCICADLLWSPGPQSQAWSRILTPTPRDRRCEIYFMISANSLDEHIYGVFYPKMIAAEQAMDRQIRSRRAQDFDVKWFVERVLEEETAISSYLERMDADPGTITIPRLDISTLEEREI